MPVFGLRNPEVLKAGVDLKCLGNTTISSNGTLTMGTQTLGGTVTLNAQHFDAGAARAFIDTTGARHGLEIRSTQDGPFGAAIVLATTSASAVADDLIGDIQFEGQDDGQAVQLYGFIGMEIESSAAGSEDGKFLISCAVNSAQNEALRLSSGGLLSTDLAGAGDSLPTLFDDYDDALMVADGIRKNNREMLVDMGIMRRNKKSSSGYMLHHQPFMNLLAGGIYQSRTLIELLAQRVGVPMESLIAEARTMPEGGWLLRGGN
ncbi:hypothetical protein LCGC14_0929780 [marine sediment metagenome]|uniref:Uncharacterized protein n=1 Tax=marine sediment metagenome TaxID=412755 RepID=A0A0F9P991_9ZZZZ